jgi:hypothetical protein
MFDVTQEFQETEEQRRAEPLATSYGLLFEKKL